MKDTHFRYLPSTRKLRARLKRAVNRVAADSRLVELERRAPADQRVTNFSHAYSASLALQATILCAALANMRGRIHAGRWDAEGQVVWILGHLDRAALTAPVRAMVMAALAVPAKEKERRSKHEERLTTHQAAETAAMRSAMERRHGAA